MPVFQFKLSDSPGGWLNMISPDDDIDVAREDLEKVFGSGRVLDVRSAAEDRRDDDD